MFSFDLKSGYYHLDAHPDFQKYLGFSWVFDGKERYFQYTVLPFGLSMGPYFFTKLLRPLVEHIRSKGFRFLIYLDDGLGFGSSYDEAAYLSSTVESLLSQLGFSFNDKSKWEPVVSLRYLGFVLDLKSFALELPLDKVDKIFKTVSNESFSRKSSPRKLARICGQLASTSLVFGAVTRLMTREMYAFIADSKSWDRLRPLDNGVLSELIFWRENLKKLPQAKCLEYSMPQVMVWSDASATGGASLLLKEGVKVASILNWSDYEHGESSAFREARAIEAGLQSFAPIITGKIVKFFTDNKAVCSIVRNGSRVTSLQAIAVRIANLATIHSVQLQVEWIPRDHNSAADYLSRCWDWDDWSVSEGIFNYLSYIWGPYTIDRFANPSNKKVSRYNSKFWFPTSEGVDCFAFSWDNEINWLVPPVHLINRTLLHLKVTKAAGTLVIPEWHSAAFWPTLLTTVKDNSEAFVGVRRFSPSLNTLQDGSQVQGTLGQRFSSTLLAVNFNFSTH